VELTTGKFGRTLITPIISDNRFGPLHATGVEEEIRQDGQQGHDGPYVSDNRPFGLTQKSRWDQSYAKHHKGENSIKLYLA
jgi:hypothetical protein